jgi:hypothetical protein
LIDGFSIEKSAVLVVFISGQRWLKVTCSCELQSKNLGRLHLVTFGRKELKEGLEYVRQRAYLLRDEEKLSLYTTGVGCTNFGKTICDSLNIK